MRRYKDQLPTNNTDNSVDGLVKKNLRGLIIGSVRIRANEPQLTVMRVLTGKKGAIVDIACLMKHTQFASYIRALPPLQLVYENSIEIRFSQNHVT